MQFFLKMTKNNAVFLKNDKKSQKIGISQFFRDILLQYFFSKELTFLLKPQNLILIKLLSVQGGNYNHF